MDNNCKCLKCGWYVLAETITCTKYAYCDFYEIDIGFIYNDGLFNPERCKYFEAK